MKFFNKKLVWKVWRWNLFSVNIEWKEWDYAVVEKDYSVETYNWVVCLAIDKNKNIALIKNYRIVVDSMVYELPRWSAEKNETLEETALKEFKEEIWIQESPKTIKKLWEIFPDDWILNFKVAVYLLEFNDFLKYDVWWEADGYYENIYGKIYVSLENFKEMIKTWIIKDSYSLWAYALYISN